MEYRFFRPKPNRVLLALERGEVPAGVQIYTHDPDLIEIAGHAGLDFVMIDTEHVRIDPETMVHCIRAAEASGITPLVRVAENSPSLIRAAVEAGALGIVVPHVKDASDAKRALDAMRYPPEGRCGICPSIRACYYSQEAWEEYMDYSNKHVMFIPLLEDVEAIENAGDIISLLKPGRDAVGLGLADIAHSLLSPGQKLDWQHPYLKEAYEKVLAITQRANIPIIGMPWPKADRDSARQALERGVRILIYFPDHYLWYEICKKIAEDVKALSKRPR